MASTHLKQTYRPNGPSDSCHRLIAIGASAGGLNAFSVILAALPKNFPAPIVIVQHLSADFPSKLAQLLGSATRLSVKQAQQGDQLQAGHVYVAPPGEHLIVNSDASLSLSLAPKVHHCRPSADVLLESVAESFGARAIGVVLTGGDGDGSAGIQAVKAAGGVTIAQDEGSSQQPSMPLHAAATGSVDFVLPLRQVAAKLVALVTASSSASTPCSRANASPSKSSRSLMLPPVSPPSAPPENAVLPKPEVAVLSKVSAVPRTSARRLRKVFNPDMVAEDTALVRVQAAWRRAGQFSGDGAKPGEPGKLVTAALREIDTCLEALTLAEAVLVDQNDTLEEFQSLLREERQHYKALLSIAAEGIVSTDTAGIVRAMNPAAARLLGRSAAYMVGRPFARNAPQRVRPVFEGAMREALAAGGSRKGVSLTARAGLPSVIATAAATKNEQGVTLGLLWLLHPNASLLPPNDPGLDGKVTLEEYASIEAGSKEVVLEATHPEELL